jgi:hypothetical protein
MTKPQFPTALMERIHQSAKVNQTAVSLRQMVEFGMYVLLNSHKLQLRCFGLTGYWLSLYPLCSAPPMCSKSSSFTHINF